MGLEFDDAKMVFYPHYASPRRRYHDYVSK
jgi:hypothetical protein